MMHTHTQGRDLNNPKVQWQEFTPSFGVGEQGGTIKLQTMLAIVRAFGYLPEMDVRPKDSTKTYKSISEPNDCPPRPKIRVHPKDPREN